MKKLLILGAGAQARYVINIVRMLADREIIGLIDTFDNPDIWNKAVDGIKVLGNINCLKDYPPSDDLLVIVGVANLQTKRKIAETTESRGYQIDTAIHPSTVIAPDAVFGSGCIVNAGVVVEPGVKVGRHTIIHAGSIIEHDNQIEDFVNIGSKVTTAGRVKIKNGAIIYTGASIIPDCTIGENAIVGAGAVVISDVTPGTTVAGVPARPLR